MSLKCSLFGHRYGDPSVDRDREESGSEVVVTITETETCTRCGIERVVSENTEVTTVESDDALDLSSGSDADRPSADGESGPVGDEAAGGEVVSASDEPEIPDAEGGETLEPTGDADEGEIGSASAGTDETALEADPETDDGIILEDEDADEPERDPGQWPEESEPDRAPTPGELADEALADRLVEPGGSNGASGDESPATEGEDLLTPPEGTFYCEECGFTTGIESSSLREGDFCPECHRGALGVSPEE